ncbi:MAG: hypothetical protein BroJett025_10960 [Patescibacteria group bacterium]|nr:MAG: hypothetical protein BroJett025_10960 [Patescibacteria group bacterium]
MKYLSKKITTVLTALGLFLSKIVFVHAQIKNPVTGELGADAEEAASGEIFVSYFVTLWNAFITIGAIAVLIMFLWGALEWITAGGEASKIEKARNRIMQSFLGLLILVSSFVIIGFVSQLFFGEEFSILNLTFTQVGGEE